MASVTTVESVRSTTHLDAPPFSLLEQQGLGSRLIKEIAAAFRELGRDPRGFIGDLFSADTRDAKRRQRIYAGLSIAVVVHIALLVLIAVLGWRTIFVKRADTNPRDRVSSWVGPPIPSADERVIPKGDKDSGGGIGGGNNPLPPTRGPLPPTSSTPPIVKANAPSAPIPTIQVQPTTLGADSSQPPPGVPLGVPTGVIAEAPSPGPGGGDGLGGKEGPGAGLGGGPGSGNGKGGNSGNKGRPGLQIGRDDFRGTIPYNLIQNFPDRTPIAWIYRPTPIVTREAQQNKVKGEVWLRATFHDDGTISDIEVIREVEYMTESAIESLSRSRFRPATVKGRPVTLTNVPVRVNVDVVKR